MSKPSPWTDHARKWFRCTVLELERKATFGPQIDGEGIWIKGQQQSDTAERETERVPEFSKAEMFRGSTSRMASGSFEAFLEDILLKELKETPDAQLRICAPELLYHRYLNHRLLDIMQDQVDLIRSGMVRRIAARLRVRPVRALRLRRAVAPATEEWRLEKASCFPENECLCSTTFEAAGVFYPSGYLGAKEGPTDSNRRGEAGRRAKVDQQVMQTTQSSSFAIASERGPAGSMIKCWLSVGKHKREAKCGFEKPGYFGRTNFCRFENSIDPDDTTLLVLEIDEACRVRAETEETGGGKAQQGSTSLVKVVRWRGAVEDRGADELNRDKGTPGPQQGPLGISSTYASARPELRFVKLDSTRMDAIRSSERRQNSRILEEDSMRSMPPSPVFVRCDRRADRRRSGRTGRALHRQRRRTSAAERRRATVERRGEHVEAEVADPHLKSVAGALTDLLKTNGTGTAANNSAIIGTIKDLLEKNMKGHVKESFEKSVQAIEESKHEFAQCRLAYEKADPVRFPKASLLQANSTPWYEAYFQAYSQCKAWEGQVAADLTACDYYCTSQVKIMGENCTNLGLQCGPLDCAPVSGEGYKAFLDRMISDIKVRATARARMQASLRRELTTERGGDVGGVSGQIGISLGFSNYEGMTGVKDARHRFMGQIEALQLARSGPGRYNLTHRCQDILGTAERCFKNCDGHIEEIIPKSESDIPGCCAPRTQAEDAKCKELANQRKAWEDYDVCYDSKFPQWETTKAEQLAQMPSLQAQMRSILRMICYIESFGENQAAKLNQCMEKDYTKHPEVVALTLEPGLPDEEKVDAFSCNASETPGTEAFDELHYHDLPVGGSPASHARCPLRSGGFVNVKAMNVSTTSLAPLVEKTTVKSHCFKKGESQTAVFWDLGSAQDVGTVSAIPSAGVARIKAVAFFPFGPPFWEVRGGATSSPKLQLSCSLRRESM
ncbi:unnamed protein product [Durusdinium trenchii]|uniref:Uncharacterized protein n=1 Tax=Durusdinium trenchii TaxID=1381693 RepID=A0ABP0P2K1_9DINO